jgi:uncharacterized membrane protein YgdD (TMEM256/DUF423 family)
MRRLLFAIAALAGLFGAARVGAAAAAAHLGGGQLLATAAIFLMIHSAAVFGLVALAERVPRQGAAVFALASVLLLAGMVLFCGDFALRALADRPLLPMAAPSGGVLLIAGWVVGAFAAAMVAFSRDGGDRSAPG